MILSCGLCRLVHKGRKSRVHKRITNVWYVYQSMGLSHTDVWLERGLEVAIPCVDWFATNG